MPSRSCFHPAEHIPLRVRIESEYLFPETDNERLCWQLCENGHVQQRGDSLSWHRKGGRVDP